MFDFEMLAKPDYDIAMQYLGEERKPDVNITPDGHPYLYRWHLKPRDNVGVTGNLYFHIQVADDPERPLHDHPWDNMSVILAGGYDETVPWVQAPQGPSIISQVHRRVAGDVVFRKATDAHHLKLLPGELYTLTQFATGPKVREWGFWAPTGWVPANSVIETLPDGRSIYKGPRT